MTLILTKDTPLSLVKENIDNVTKEITTEPLKQVIVGAGWSSSGNGSKNPDLDLIISTNNRNEICFFNNLKLFGGTIQHSGDSRTGEGDGDDETIFVDLEKLPTNVTTLEVALSSYNGFNFSQIQDEYISITDAVSKIRLAKSKDNLSGSGQTLILAIIVKEDGVWTVNLVNKITAHTCSEYLRTKGDF